MPSATRRHTSRGRAGVAPLLPILGFVLVYLVVNDRWPVPYWVAGLYIVSSISCFVLYAIDKSAARSGRWRVSENTLLVWGVLGGWPGAIVAQQLLRHKTQKASFRSAFWVSVIVNLIAFALVLTPVFTFFAAWASARS
jgi:uncharacterized membrane protein YsdA (DUF1294 family)